MSGTSTYSTVVYNGLEVVWTPELDGGGRTFGQDFVPITRRLFGRAEHIYDACAGCGFIGFSLLAHGLCDRLTLSDIHPDAVAAMRETVRRNNLTDTVSVYEADGLAGIPKTPRFDLVVCNPPDINRAGGNLITDDPEWAFHRSFYLGIADFLNPGASILFQEHSGGTEPEVFLPMLAAGGLAYIQVLCYAAPGSAPGFYFLWSKSLGREIIGCPPAPPESVALELAPSGTEYEFAPDRWYSVTLVNRLGRSVQLVLRSETGEGVHLSLEPDQTARLPSVLPPPGQYRLCDVRTDTPFVTINVPA